MKKCIQSAAAIAAAAMFFASPASAQKGPGGYPKEPLRFVVAFAPGGGTDIVARLVAAHLSTLIGQQVVVENRAGASGILAAQFVAKAEPNGYTLLVGGSGPMVFNPITYSKLPYDPIADFEPVTILGSYPVVLTANNKFKANTVGELIALAKTKPGQLNYGSAGASFQVPAEHFSAEAGIEMTQIPYKGTALGAQALLAGDIDLLVADIAPVVPLIQGGNIKALAVSSAKRSPVLPNVPTIAESGVPGFDFTLFSAVAAPKGTPTAITGYLQEQIAKVLSSPDVKERLAAMGIEPGGMSPQASAARYKKEIELFGPVAKAANIRAD